jgi:hypothetical protein
VNLDGCISIELSHTRCRDGVPGLSNIIWCEEKLGGQISELHEGGVIERETLDTSQRDVLGDFNTKTLQSNNQDI